MLRKINSNCFIRFLFIFLWYAMNGITCIEIYNYEPLPVKPNPLLNLKQDVNKSSRHVNSRNRLSDSGGGIGSSKRLPYIIHLNNITATNGENIILNCPILIAFDAKNESVNENNNIENMDSLIRTVIWTHELATPKLLSNNNETFAKTSRYNIRTSNDITKLDDNMDIPVIYYYTNYSSSRASPAQTAANSYAIYKNYALKICNLVQTDSGWYSCHIIKQSQIESNIKYFIYLNVTSEQPGQMRTHYVHDCEEVAVPKTVRRKKLKTKPTITTTSQSTKPTDDSNAEVPDAIAPKVQATTSAEAIVESVQVMPKYLNISEFKSFQFDCIYTGPNYDLIHLKWYRNGVRLDLTNNKRLFTLNYKQFSNNYNLLKFSYSLVDDGGLYSCRPFLNGKVLNLKDTIELHVHEDTSKLQAANAIATSHGVRRQIELNFLVFRILCIWICVRVP